MPTLYLIDGNSYLYRAFYAIKRLSSSSGFPTNAIYGFTTMILKILEQKKPDYFTIVFDSPGPTHRHEAYEQYKAHRPSMPDDLKLQVPIIKDIIAAFNIHTIEKPGFEADDLLAVIAKRAEKEGVDVFIVTGDKDLCQVITPKIKIYDSMKEKVTGEKDVIERFGVEPKRIPEIMALMGDASDNIPGVPGIGEKTAVKLIKEFGSLDGVVKNHAEIKQPKLRESIAANIPNIELSLSLATVNLDAPAEVSMEELEEKEPDWPKLFEIFSKYELRSLVNLVPKEEQTVSKFNAEYVTITDEALFKEVIASIKHEVTIDTETTSKSPVLAELVGISLSVDPEKAYYIPLAHYYLGAPKQLSKEYVIKELRVILEDPDIKKTGHNIKYDLIVLKNEGIDLKGVAFDTMLASYLLNPNRSNHGLDDVAMSQLSIEKISFKDVVGKLNGFSEVSVEDATRYSGEDSAVTLKLKRHLEPMLQKEGLYMLFNDMEMPLVEVLADMEMSGIKIDSSLMTSLSEKLGRELESIEKRIYFIAGEEFNINSPKQLQEVLYEKLGLRKIKKTKTGYSTDVDVLEELSLEHELPKEILEYRGLSKIKNTYLDALPKIVNPKTGRIHTSFNQTITATGRLSSSDPNLQNIPARGEWGTRIRQAFIAEEGNLLLSSDYSQIELRILAHLSGDEGLIDVFNNGGDIHSRTASGLFGIPAGEVTSEMRRRAKVVNFGIVYGMSPYGLSKELTISPGEAKDYIDTYFAQHPGVSKYIAALIEEVTHKGYVTTLYNRKRAIPELQSTNKNIKQLGERLAINTPIQGSAADVIKIAMINIHNRIINEKLRMKMLLQVHDELLFEVPEDEAQKAEALVREEMENVIKLHVPLKVDIGIGKNWAEAH
ncbi:MAG: DNA polymerase I [Thermodesulfovibrionia bacterium]|nr:DNA polymerase I [Thermodesulfovibrionia bacterium]